MMRVMYKWLAGASYLETVATTGHSSITVSTYMKCCRNIVSSFTNNEDQMIGGAGIIVEIDESVCQAQISSWKEG